MRRHDFLLIVTSFNALLSVIGGLGLITGLISPPAQYIDGTIFGNYVVPGLILTLVVGGISAYASLRLAREQTYARDLAGLAGLVMMGWIVGEVAVIDAVSWLQILFFLTGFATAEAAYPGSKELRVLLQRKHILRRKTP